VLAAVDDHQEREEKKRRKENGNAKIIEATRCLDLFCVLVLVYSPVQLQQQLGVIYSMHSKMQVAWAETAEDTRKKRVHSKARGH